MREALDPLMRTVATEATAEPADYWAATEATAEPAEMVEPEATAEPEAQAVQLLESGSPAEEETAEMVESEATAEMVVLGATETSQATVAKVASVAPAEWSVATERTAWCLTNEHTPATGDGLPTLRRMGQR